VRQPTIHIGWPAWHELFEVPWRDDVEVSAGLLGHADPDGNLLIERIAPPERQRAARYWMHPT
jgi:hypothetical protein